ncbi:disease resistance-like protein DSC1 isoform X1 [Prosopis cineraria]|uniref:disease resistance-like protein DSC1 isoform X1 n=2 Tax=Prosopis cineraria TaxID=364024 RepID=UPI00240FA082|nr:disease resistance-like protein DSC1 isoform X1 [Prosopis cineraria]
MNEDAGSSSPSFSYGWKYHVFLSFRGEDTRHGFAGNLYRDLRERGIRTFLDDQGIRKGEQITQTLLKVIQESKNAIVIFSENYAFSTFCLKELVQILDCVKGDGRFVWPVFYHVDPSDVRYQKGSYKVAFDKHEGDKDDKLVERWRLALSHAAELVGWSVKPSTESYEYEIIEKIIEVVSKEINIGHFHVAPFPVGLESRVKEVCSLLNEQPYCDGAKMVGIYGLPGVGKTTLARAVYNEMASQFRHVCFLDNIREKPIQDLPITLLSKTIREKDIGLEHDKSGIPIIKDRLCNIKVLLILDDIDSPAQLQALAGEPDWFGSGSIIIITTKDKKLAKQHGGSRIYEVQGLNKDEARELLIWNAFRNKEADPEYEDVINRAVHYAGGLPLVLETLGSKLCDLTVHEWESTLDIYKKIPEKTVLKFLKVSYDSLEEEHQQVFLDIACFYKGCRSKYATNMLWCSHGSRPESCIRALIDKCLVKIDQGGLKMHDLIQDMGREIVRQQSPLKPGKRSRLWSSEDILHVLQECMGTDELEAIKLDFSNVREVCCSEEAFDKMKSLKVLIINNAKFSGSPPKSLPSSLRVLDWMGYPSTTLPPNFNPGNLVILNLPYSRLVTLEKQSFQWGNLRYLNLEHNENLMEVPDMSRALNLEELHVAHCKNLTTIGSSVGHLAKLKVLGAQWCTKLKSFIEDGIKLTSLEILNLTGCSDFQIFPEILEKMNSIKTLALSGTAIEKLPESIEKLVGLECLYLHNCSSLRQIPVDSFCKLTKLLRLEAGSCGIFNWLKDQEVKWPVNLVFSHVTRLHLNQNNISDELLALILRWFPGLHVLELRDNNITVLPAFIQECSSLKRLYLDRCKQLREISVIPPNIKVLSAVNCMSLTSMTLDLLSQALHEAGNTKFILPGEWIPACFQCSNIGSSVAFRVRKRFPEIAVCVVFDVKGRGSCHFEFEIQVLINDTHNFVVKTDVLDIETGHIYLFDDLWHQSLFEFRRELPEEKFNHVQISCSAYHKDVSDAFVLVKCIGVYVYNLESCMDDILLENLNPPKRILEDWFCDEDMMSWVYSDSSREDSLYYKYYHAIEAYESSSSDVNSYDINSDGLQQQQHLAHNEEQILESTENVRKAEEEDIVVYRDNADEEKGSNTFDTEYDHSSLKGQLTKAESVPCSPESMLESDQVAFKGVKETDLQRQQHSTGMQEKILESSGNVGKARDKDMLVYRDDANKEKDSNTLSEDPMEWEYQVACWKDRLVLNDQSTGRDDKGYEGTGSKQHRDRCACLEDRHGASKMTSFHPVNPSPCDPMEARSSCLTGINIERHCFMV